MTYYQWTNNSPILVHTRLTFPRFDPMHRTQVDMSKFRELHLIRGEWDGLKHVSEGQASDNKFFAGPNLLSNQTSTRTLRRQSPILRCRPRPNPYLSVSDILIPLSSRPAISTVFLRRPKQVAGTFLKRNKTNIHNKGAFQVMYHKYVLSTYEKLASGDPIGYEVHKCVGVACNDQQGDHRGVLHAVQFSSRPSWSLTARYAAGKRYPQEISKSVVNQVQSHIINLAG